MISFPLHIVIVIMIVVMIVVIPMLRSFCITMLNRTEHRASIICLWYRATVLPILDPYWHLQGEFSAVR